MVTTTKGRTATALAGLASALALVLTGCGTADSGAAADPTTGSTATGEASEEAPQFPVTVTDMAGNEVTIESADRVVVTDNRVFQLVHDWGIEVVAAPRLIMSPNNPMQSDESILDIGSHAEPDFEQVIAADPDLVINGYRFSADNETDMRKAAPDAAFVVMDNTELPTDEYVVETVTLLGEVFGKQDEAKALVDRFHAAIETAKEAYDPATKVMGLVTSANEIRYSSHTEGRGASIFFSLLGMTPALDAEGSSNHQGDDISLEGIAEANADFFLVLDRDAAVADDGEATPALDLILESASLANVPAVQNKAIYVMPGDYYLTEDIFAFTTVLEELAEAFQAL